MATLLKSLLEDSTRGVGRKENVLDDEVLSAEFIRVTRLVVGGVVFPSVSDICAFS